MIHSQGGVTVYVSSDEDPYFGDWCVKETVGWWDLNENNGTIAYDRSGQDNHGSCYGTVWTPGCVLSGLLFWDALDSYVSIGDDPSLDFDNLGMSEGFMVEFCMRKNQTLISEYAALINKEDGGGYFINLRSDDRIAFGIKAADGSEATVVSDTTISDINQHRIAAVWSRETLYLYVDPEVNPWPDASVHIGDFALADTWAPLTIGHDGSTDGNHHFSGVIDDLRISLLRDDSDLALVQYDWGSPAPGYAFYQDTMLAWLTARIENRGAYTMKNVSAYLTDLPPNMRLEPDCSAFKDPAWPLCDPQAKFEGALAPGQSRWSAPDAFVFQVDLNREVDPCVVPTWIVEYTDPDDCRHVLYPISLFPMGEGPSDCSMDLFGFSEPLDRFGAVRKLQRGGP